MGTIFSGYSRSADNTERKGRKRTLSEDDSDDESETDQVLHTPQRKKMKCTSKYIYNALFVNGENSDITIHALGKDWPLHKIYLCQSSYFASMFSGSWKESKLSEIDIDIPDTNIDEEALQVALGSLYRDDVLLEPVKVVSVLAAASLLQLEGLIQQCADIMTETISPKTVCSYYSAATSYGLQQVAKSCLEWLELNLMVAQKPALLREISPDLFEQVIRSPNLFVLQVEMDVYSMVKKYVFLRLTPSWHGDSKTLGRDADNYFRRYDAGCFLKSELGAPFSKLFSALRLGSIINEPSSCRHVEDDKIITQDCLLPVYRQQWQHMLAVEHGQDLGPKEETVSLEQFDQLSMRCGRIIKKEAEYCWRWTGFNFGVDLLVTFTNRLIILRRNTGTHPVTASVSLQNSRSIMFRIRIVSFDSQGQILYQKVSDLTPLSLHKDEEVVVLNIDRHAPFPMQIGVNVLCVTPPQPVVETAESLTLQQPAPRQQQLSGGE
ncbi:germ cell-less protein-like 1 [Diadema antillarum]|uniref:germ cell-less protein-like 1 n=1 Tax=Diadema antillarum TaxID=105358 RepID=UPI003A8B9C7E